MNEILQNKTVLNAFVDAVLDPRVTVPDALSPYPLIYDQEPKMLHHPLRLHLNRPARLNRLTRLLACTSAVAALCACTTPLTGMRTPQSATQPAPQSESSLAAFSTVMAGMNQVPPLPKSLTAATGRVDAVLDKNTRLLRWKLSYRGLTGAAIAGHFHGPATVGASSGVALPFKGALTSPMDGQATLTPEQMTDLLAGRWYVNIHTLAFPGGEIRGQMILRE